MINIVTWGCKGDGAN